MKFGGGFELDSTIHFGQFTSEKNARGMKYSIILASACKSKSAYVNCKDKYKIDILAQDLFDNDKGTVMIIRDVKNPPNSHYDSEFCRSNDNTLVLTWVDYSHLNQPRISSAWQVSDSAVEWIEVPVDAVNCSGSEENEGEVN